MIGLVSNGLAAIVNLCLWNATDNAFCLYMAGVSLVIGLGFAIIEAGR